MYVCVILSIQTFYVNITGSKYGHHQLTGMHPQGHSLIRSQAAAPAHEVRKTVLGAVDAARENHGTGSLKCSIDSDVNGKIIYASSIHAAFSSKTWLIIGGVPLTNQYWCMAMLR